MFTRSIIDNSRRIIDNSRSINDKSRSIIENPRSIIDNSRSVIDNSRVMLQLVVSFTMVIFFSIGHRLRFATIKTLSIKTGNSDRRERSSTVGLLVKVARFTDM